MAREKLSRAFIDMVTVSFFLSTVKPGCKRSQILVERKTGRQLLPELIQLCVPHSSALLRAQAQFTSNNQSKANGELWGQNTSVKVFITGTSKQCWWSTRCITTSSQRCLKKQCIKGSQMEFEMRGGPWALCPLPSSTPAQPRQGLSRLWGKTAIYWTTAFRWAAHPNTACSAWESHVLPPAAFPAHGRRPFPSAVFLKYRVSSRSLSKYRQGTETEVKSLLFYKLNFYLYSKKNNS